MLRASAEALALARSELEKSRAAALTARCEAEQAAADAQEAKRGREKLVSSLYSSAVRHFLDGNLDATDALFECYLEAVGEADLLRDRATYDWPTAQDYAAFEPLFRNFLTGKRLSWQAGEVPMPHFIRESNNVEGAPILFTGTRIFFIFPQHIFNNRQNIECDIKDHLCESARNAGLQVNHFFGDNILYPHLGLDPAKAMSDLVMLRAQIHTMRPDVIVFDANFMGQEVGINFNYLSRLKEETGARLIGFMGDVWGTHWIEIANYWGPVADLIMYIVPDGPFVKASSFNNNMLSSPYPVNTRNFFPDPVKNFDLSFFGSHAYLRPFWLAHALRAAARLGLKINVREHQRTSDCPNVAEYAEILRRSHMVLNFSSRGEGTKIITGRAWQALNSGSLLLEEENDQTKYYFEPFIHYVPFENAAQLERLVEFFYKNPDQAAIIGQSASAFCTEHYGAAAIWSRILGAPQLRPGANAESTAG